MVASGFAAPVAAATLDAADASCSILAVVLTLQWMGGSIPKNLDDVPYCSDDSAATVE